jgi:hypothetical protein
MKRIGSLIYQLLPKKERLSKLPTNINKRQKKAIAALAIKIQ